MAAPVAAAPTDYRAIGQHIASQNGVPWPIFNAMIHQESGWDNGAVSPVGALGFGQLMPGTAKGLGVNPSDPVQNLQGAAKYLKMQFQKFGRWDLALAAYNAGAGAVSKYGGVPPYQETQNYVKNIMAAAAAGGGDTSTVGGKAGQGQSGLPPIGGAVSPIPTIPGSFGGGASKLTPLQGLLNFTQPSDASVAQLGSLGGMAMKAAKASQAPIDPGQQLGLPGLSIPGLAQSPLAAAGAGKQQTDPYQINAIPLQGQLNGQVPEHPGGQAISSKYPNLSAQSHVDWEHVNPRLLKVMNDVAAKNGVVITLSSGYRNNANSASGGGFAGDPHTHGVAVDAWVNGHAVGDVIPPEVWAKAGVRSGNTPGFYKGKPDPMHLDLVGIPVKGGPTA